MFDDLYSKVREYAQQRRLEESTRKARGDPMDIGQLRQSWNEWYQEGQEGRMQDDHGLDALGKGKGQMKGKSKGWSKGKGNGFQTVPPQYDQTQWSTTSHGKSKRKGDGCQTDPQQYDQMPWNTPNYGKRKGWGKGPVCWHCGIQGHPWRLCPSLYPELSGDVDQKGKGEGKPWNEGKGRGAYEVNCEDSACE